MNAMNQHDSLVAMEIAEATKGHEGKDLEPLTKPPWLRCFESGRDARKSEEATHVVEER